MKETEIFTALRSVSAFEPLQDAHLQWLVQKGSLTQLEPGEYLFKKGDPVDNMHIILQGSIQIKTLQGRQLKDLQVLEKGDITGVLPYSRMKEAVGFGIALSPATIFSLHKEHFQEMEQHSHEMVQALVAVMTTRARDYTRRQQQDDKMMSLGKLSAGLAHELNNPASAIVRSSASLRKHLRTTPESFKQIISVKLDTDQVDEINSILFARLNQPPEQRLSVLERSQQEDEIAEWLEDLGMEDGFDIAETMVDFGFNVSDLEEISDITHQQYLAQVIRWLQNILTTEKMVSEIEQASTRISDLVQSVKTYSHMDRATDKEAIDLHKGIDSTLTMLGHKLRQQNIQLVREYAPDLPKIKAFVSELNQVWTNLIDNAIDAMEKGGTLTIATARHNSKVAVKIQDNGSGIPPDTLGHIFDPFFTTKAVGKGTGLGLDITKKIIDQHQATIEVTSEPGKTIFTIRFNET